MASGPLLTENGVEYGRTRKNDEATVYKQNIEPRSFTTGLFSTFFVLTAKLEEKSNHGQSAHFVRIISDCTGALAVVY